MHTITTHHPGISSNITYATYFSTAPTPPSLAHRPLQSHWRTTHVTYAGMCSTLACHQHKHTTHASRPPTQARYLRHRGQHKEHAISQTPGYPVSSQIPRENLAVFTFSFYLYNSLYFLGLLKYIHKNLENCHRKMKLFQRKLVCIIQTKTIFSKTNAQFY